MGAGALMGSVPTRLPVELAVLFESTLAEFLGHGVEHFGAQVGSLIALKKTPFCVYPESGAQKRRVTDLEDEADDGPEAVVEGGGAEFAQARGCARGVAEVPLADVGEKELGHQVLKSVAFVPALRRNEMGRTSFWGSF